MQHVCGFVHQRSTSTNIEPKFTWRVSSDELRHDEEGKKFDGSRKVHLIQTISTVDTLYANLRNLVERKEGRTGSGRIDERLEGDAQLGARLIRSYCARLGKRSGQFCSVVPAPHHGRQRYRLV